jgi:hypothetical protein
MDRKTFRAITLASKGQLLKMNGKYHYITNAGTLSIITDKSNQAFRLNCADMIRRTRGSKNAIRTFINDYRRDRIAAM